MNGTYRTVDILMADDDHDDRMLMKEALSESNLVNSLKFVEDGAELLDYLYQKGKFASNSTLPGLILLDLNMPKLDGRDALKLIKSDPDLKKIPVIVLTTSRDEGDIAKAYELGANSFITKPSRYIDLLQVTSQIDHYWFRTVTLPKK